MYVDFLFVVDPVLNTFTDEVRKSIPINLIEIDHLNTVGMCNILIFHQFMHYEIAVSQDDKCVCFSSSQYSAF